MGITYYPGVCTILYRYLVLSGLIMYMRYIIRIYTGTEWGVLTIQGYVLSLYPRYLLRKLRCIRILYIYIR